MKKVFFVPKKWKTQDVVLEFEGIYGTARVWINGGLAHTQIVMAIWDL